MFQMRQLNHMHMDTEVNVQPQDGN